MKKLIKILVFTLLVGCGLCAHSHNDECVYDEKGNCTHQCVVIDEYYEHKEPEA